MRRAASTYVFVNDRLHPGLLDGLARSGAAAIEIFAARGHFNYADRHHVREVAAWFRSTSVEFHSMHSPMNSDEEWGRRGGAPVNIAALDKKRRIDAMDEVKRALEVAEQAPFRFLVQHLGLSGEEFDPRKFEVAVSSIEHLHAFARPLGVTLLLENIPNELSTPERLLEFVRAGRFDDVGFCFDLGHAHIMSKVETAFHILKERIHSTHVHDNAGDKDAHLWPGQGTLAWPEALALLRSAPHRPPLLLEIEGEGKSGLLEGMAAAFEKLEGYASAETRQAS
jgi:sugar phosphate isomerase/epimerase